MSSCVWEPGRGGWAAGKPTVWTLWRQPHPFPLWVSASGLILLTYRTLADEMRQSMWNLPGLCSGNCRFINVSFLPSPSPFHEYFTSVSQHQLLLVDVCQPRGIGRCALSQDMRSLLTRFPSWWLTINVGSWRFQGCLPFKKEHYNSFTLHFWNLFFAIAFFFFF